MYVFIDESGDAGFKVDKGASPIFAAAMVIFASSEDALRTQTHIEKSAVRKVHKTEFKFSKCCNQVRDEFFQTVRQCPFLVRAVVVRKEVIYSPKLKTDKERFYNYFIRSMLNYDNEILQGARVIIDGSGDRVFRKNLASEMRAKLGRGRVKDVRFKDSQNDALVQLADMCAGAIARSSRKDRAHSWRWRDSLRPRIDDVWDFK